MPRSKKERNNVLDMMGYGGGGSDDDGDADFEAELAAMIGGGGIKKAAKKPAPKLIDWSIIDAQVASSMRDVDEDDDDDDLSPEDESDLMSELNGLIEEDEPALLKPAAPNRRDRSPSPQPQRPGDMVDELKSRKTMYETAIKNAQSKGESAKVRRLQRGIKTIDTLLRSAKLGKAINEADIPPVVATGQPPSQTSTSAPEIPIPEVDLRPKETSPTPTVPTKIMRSSPSPIKAAPIVEISPATTNEVKIDQETVKLLEERKDEYKSAAIQAKRAGDKEKAINYFHGIKQCNELIDSANAGNKVDSSIIPPPITAAPVAPLTTVEHPTTSAEQSSSVSNQAAAETAPAVPKTALEALEQRMQKYQSTSDAAKKEGNSSKARRMGRIVKQYQDAIKSHKAGRKVNFNELPVPPGFPPIPGVNEVHQPDVFQQANALMQQNVDDEEEDPSSLKPPATVVRKASPQRSGDPGASQRVSPSPQPSNSATNRAPTKFDQQVSFLENRQAAFKTAALAAKHRGDRSEALKLLRQMKGFDSMIEAAKGGMKVDISKVPQPPVDESSGGTDDDFEIIHMGGSKNTPEEDEALYKRLLETLTSQVKKARAYAQQMTHAGDVGSAERCDRLATNSQADYDYVRNCKRHGDPPPRFNYQQQVFETVRLIPDIGTNEMELVIVQCMDLHSGGKDKLFVEWELPFPHDSPIRGHTEETKVASASPKFNGTFRVPFTRKLKSSQRAIRNKSLKLDVIVKGGFLRSDKSVGSAQVKLAALDSHCELHTVEELREGRSSVGKIEVYVRLRSPLSESESKKNTERWLFVQHVKRQLAPPQASSSSRKSTSPNRGQPRPSARSSEKTVNIASIDVLELELKVVRAKIEHYKKRGSAPPTALVNEAKQIREKIDNTKKFLREGGSHARKEYISCLKQQYQYMSIELQAHTKQGKREQAKLALTKKNFLKAELDKLTQASQ